MYNHGDVQCPSHGSCTACIQNIWLSMVKPVIERIYIHHTSNNTRIHVNHVREYQSQLWNNFSSLRTFQRSLIQTATLCNAVHGVISIPKIYISRRRERRKIRAQHIFQNILISQQRTSQMIRWPPRDPNPWSAIRLYRRTRSVKNLVRGQWNA